MRITSSMMMKNYTRNLNNSMEALNKASNQSTTGRSFDKVSDNPVLAAEAYRLRRQTSLNSDYTSNMVTTDSVMSTAESSMMSIHSAIQEVSNGDLLKGITGTSGPDERLIIATKLRTMQGNVLAQLNSKYADTYVFGGSGSNEMPFSCDSNGNLLYRGVDVNTGILANEDGSIATLNKLKVSFGKDNGETFNDFTMELNVGAGVASNSVAIDTDSKKITISLMDGATGSDLQNVLQDSSAYAITGASPFTADFSKITVTGDLTGTLTSASSGKITNKADLSLLANEKMYTDIGLGLKFNADGSVNSQSAMETSIIGISFMGYGTNDEGINNNIYNLLGDIADKLEATDFNVDETQKCIDNLQSQAQNLLSSITAIGVKSNYVTDTKERLEDESYNLDVKTQSVEYTDLARAITNFKMQEFSYRAALQMSSSILQSTLLDYLN